MESFVVLKVKQLSSEWCITHNAPNMGAWFLIWHTFCTFVPDLGFLLFFIYFLKMWHPQDNSYCLIQESQV